jgi:thiopeptide-type bacteriocin biosynthesis protein
LYAKLYTGQPSVDGLLAESVPAIVEAARSLGIERWFFIRYGDPEWHLRLRFEGEPRALWGPFFEKLHRWADSLVQQRMIRKLQLDTYERELERYGGDAGIELAEALFASDSRAVLSVLGHLPEDATDEDRWRIGLWGVHRLLVDLGFDLDQRLAIAQALRDQYVAFVSPDVNARRRFGEIYRAERGVLSRLIEPGSSQLEAIGAAFAERGAVLASLGVDLRARERELTQPLTKLAASYVHMHLNRTLKVASRPRELLVYEMLTRLYDSASARARKGH